jgi:hypothetical protein
MEAIGLETLLRGYQQAYQRWMTGPRIDPEPEAAFFAIFEALNWAVAVDNRLKTTFRGRWPGTDDERGYRSGFRYARNAVHHDWARALWVDHRGVYPPTPLPAPFFEWCWAPALRSTRSSGRTQYLSHLSGKPVRFTLEALESLYVEAVATVTAVQRA